MKLFVNSILANWRYKTWPFLTGQAPAFFNRQIIGASLAVAVVTGLVKLAGMAKEIVVAWRFGTSDDLDAFNVALIVPSALLHIVATPFQVSFIPAYIQTQQQHGDETARQLLSQSIAWLLGLFTLIALLMMAGGAVYLSFLVPEFTAEKLGLTYRLHCLLAPMTLLMGIHFLISGVLNVKGKFALTTATPLITTAVTVLLLIGAGAWGIYALAIAITLGAGLELTLTGMALRREQVLWQPCWPQFSRPLKKIVNASVTLMLGNLFLAGINVASVMLAAQLPSGSVAAFGYANKMSALTAGLIATSLGTVAMPLFARISAQSDWQKLKQTLHRLLGFALLIALPTAILLMVFSQSLTQLLFRRGAFVNDDVELVAGVLFFLALQIPFYVANTVAARIFIALQEPRFILYTSAGSLVVFSLFAALLVGKLGLIGIAISLSATYIFSSLTFYFGADRRLSQLIGS